MFTCIHYITSEEYICQINVSHIMFSMKQLAICFGHKDKCLGKNSTTNTKECPIAAAMFVNLTDLVARHAGT